MCLLVRQSDSLIRLRCTLLERVSIQLLEEVEYFKGDVVEQELCDLSSPDKIGSHLVLNKKAVAEDSLQHLLVR